MTDMMLAARFHGVEEGLRLEEVPVPRPGPDEVLVKVDACGICLSDVHMIDGGLPRRGLPPVVPGHEASGTVVALGSGVDSWAAGDRVTVMGGRQCERCAMCLQGHPQDCVVPTVMGFHYDGAWAEYTVARRYSLTRVPDGIPATEAAILVDAVATPFAALRNRAALRAGETVGLWGVGGLGVHAVQLARLMGAGLVVAVDPRAAARERALAAGADLAFDPAGQGVVEAIRQATDGLGLDVALDLAGRNVALKQAGRCLGRDGRLLIVGLSAEPVELAPSVVLGTQRQSLLGHLGYDKRDVDTLMRLLAAGRIDLSGSITQVIPLTDIADGVRRLSERREDVVRIVVDPSA